MISILTFSDFCINEKRAVSRKDTHPYFKGLSKATIEDKKRAMKKQTKMEDDNPSAYKPLPGDTKGKKMLRKSKHTQNYEEMYGA